MHRICLGLDEIPAVLHELLKCHHRVVVDVEVVCCPRFHGNQHNPGVELLFEDLTERITMFIKHTKNEEKTEMEGCEYRMWVTEREEKRKKERMIKVV